MMLKKFQVIVLLLFVIVIFLFTTKFLPAVFKYPFPPIKIPKLSNYTTLDLTSVLAGARRLGADIAWVQLLQYSGSPEKPLDKETEFVLSWDMTKYLLGIPIENGDSHKDGDANHEHHKHYEPQIEGGIYPEMLDYCYRVINIDPFFHYTYLYGAAVLGWNLNRPGEAIQLLKSGIDNFEKYRYKITSDPRQPFWQFNLYISALVYRQMDEFGKMSSILVEAVKQPNCPNVMKSILANIYEKEKNYVGSLKLWIQIYDSKDPYYQIKSEQKIYEIRKILNC